MLAIERSGAICYVSQKLQERVGSECLGESFDAYFSIKRPRLAASIGQVDLDKHTRSLFLFTDRQERFGLRGQVVSGLFLRAADHIPVHIFVVSPWLAWNEENVPDYAADFTDFTIADPQIDLSLQLKAQSVSLEQQRKLTQQLIKARDEAQEANHAKSKFVSHVTHELRTPLNGLIGALDLLGDHLDTSASRELHNVLQDSADILLNTVNTILDFSRIQSGAATLERAPFRMREEVQGVVRLLSVQARAKGLSLQVDIDDRIDGFFEGDVAKIKQCLINLIGNAIKYSQQGRIRVGLSAEGVEESEQKLRFCVEDEGPGVSEEDRPYLFEEFWVKNQQVTGDVRSTGLGLSITKGMVELMDGQIGMRTPDSGVGSEFWFELTLPRVADGEVEMREENVPQDAPRLRSARVLVADDVPVNRKIASMMLHSFGMNVDEVDSGEAALRAVESEQYDLIIIDVHMPGMGGLAAIKHMHQQHSHCQGPILAWSANGTPDEVREYLNCGARDALQKPLRRSHLVEVVSRYLSA